MASREFRYPLDAQDLEELKDSVWDIYSYILPFDISVANQTYTSTGKVGYERVFCDYTGTGTVTITLHTGAKDKQRVQPIRRCSNPVTFAAGGTDTINGSTSISLPALYDAPLAEWSDAANEWVIV